MGPVDRDLLTLIFGTLVKVTGKCSRLQRKTTARELQQLLQLLQTVAEKQKRIKNCK